MTKSGSPGHLSESLHRVSSIDALRGLAALSVVAFHAREVFRVGAVNAYHHFRQHPDFSALLNFLLAPFAYGYLGVTLFFVLSGYCIHRRGASRLVADPQARLDHLQFARRRFWRIYPTYFCALLLTAWIDWWLVTRGIATPPGQDNSLFAFMISLLSLQGYLAPTFGSNLVFWTLALEIHLYIAYPLLFFLSRRFGPGKALLFTLAAAVVHLIAIAAFSMAGHPTPQADLPVFLPLWFTWTVGFYLAEIDAGRAREIGRHAWPWIILGGVAGAVLATAIGHPEIAQMFQALLFGACLFWSIRPQGRRLWSGRLGVALAFIGVFSYSLYAIHLPVLLFLSALWTSWPTGQWEPIWSCCGAMACAVFAAWLFFHAIEWWSVRKPGEQIRYFRR
jgi:peptidoglycan/LPS O-acetylase OafA/YrhL